MRVNLNGFAETNEMSVRPSVGEGDEVLLGEFHTPWNCVERNDLWVWTLNRVGTVAALRMVPSRYVAHPI